MAMKWDDGILPEPTAEGNCRFCGSTHKELRCPDIKQIKFNNDKVTDIIFFKKERSNNGMATGQDRQESRRETA